MRYVERVQSIGRVCILYFLANIAYLQTEAVVDYMEGVCALALAALSIDSPHWSAPFLDTAKLLHGKCFHRLYFAFTSDSPRRCRHPVPHQRRCRGSSGCDSSHM